MAPNMNSEGIIHRLLHFFSPRNKTLYAERACPQLAAPQQEASGPPRPHPQDSNSTRSQGQLLLRCTATVALIAVFIGAISGAACQWQPPLPGEEPHTTSQNYLAESQAWTEGPSAHTHHARRLLPSIQTLRVGLSRPFTLTDPTFLPLQLEESA